MVDPLVRTPSDPRLDPQVQGLNGFSARQGHHGIFVHDSTRHQDDVRGETLLVEFEIVDARSKVTSSGSAKSAAVYTVLMSYAGVGATEGPDTRGYDFSAGIQHRHHFYKKVFTKPGRYAVRVPCPSAPLRAALHVHMWNEHQQYFTDRF